MLCIPDMGFGKFGVSKILVLIFAAKNIIVHQNVATSIGSFHVTAAKSMVDVVITSSVA
jgi:hypothetical protein